MSIIEKSLIDTGANGLAFINTSLAIQLAKFFGLNTVALGADCAVIGYDGNSGRSITHAIILSLTVDGRRQELPFLITNLGQHDIILGRMWLAIVGALPDCRRGRLLWPKEISLTEEVAAGCTRCLPKQILPRPHALINPKHQEDANWRTVS